MADPRFFRRRGPFSLGHLAAIAEASDVLGPDDGLFVDVATLRDAGADHVTFLDQPRYRDAARSTRAGACVTRAAWTRLLPPSTATLVCADPARGYALIARAFYPDEIPGEAGWETHVDPGAHVDATASIGGGARIEDGAVVQAHAQLGAGCQVGANAVIGPHVRIGAHSRIGAGVTLSHCLIGCRVVIHPGARIGQDGFGFVPGEPPLKIPQLGRVVVEDDVEIGANVTIDRGSGRDTVIGRGAKIDNLVQIAHNVEVGPGCLIVAQSGVAGSSRLGAGVVLAAQSGVVGHLVIGPGARLAARAAATRDLPGGRDYAGAPAVPAARWRREIASLRRLAKRSGGEDR
ncbi:MAG TPA: UDP-3-O-(3-hydroxymyristoyl)glucosamine N-acyltransferase [Geminicoccaceae bacterium]|nr:UDP-3-O-(3-hydroxymyristoyl)glucosamine N-acyltransferase [Geminicoccus sp.]HMU53335.1 UDP-3-O-(3-hydroxymyristoyl)glucosamine N-acyltransferase [Geminicoccaceae bacterium]